MADGNKELEDKLETAGFERDTDVLDTWFSSALWPFSTMGWPDETADLAKFYPTDFLTTDPDIIFRWEARMIFSALEFTGTVPFDDVYIHSTVLAKGGERMSRSKGIGEDPLEWSSVNSEPWAYDALPDMRLGRGAEVAIDLATLNAFTEGLWSDLQGSGIHAGSVIVGPIDTEIWDKLEEPPAYRGRKHPPQVAADAILRVIEDRRHQVMAPRWSFSLRLARAVRALAPGLVRLGLRRMDPVPSAALQQARVRAERGAKRNQADDA